MYRISVRKAKTSQQGSLKREPSERLKSIYDYYKETPGYPRPHPTKILEPWGPKYNLSHTIDLLNWSYYTDIRLVKNGFYCLVGEFDEKGNYVDYVARNYGGKDTQ